MPRTFHAVISETAGGYYLFVGYGSRVFYGSREAAIKVLEDNAFMGLS